METTVDPAGAGFGRWDGWRFALALVSATVAVELFAVFFLPGLFGLHQWLQMGDAHWTIQSAQYVANGGLGYVYQANDAFIPLPGFLLLLAPLAALGDHLNLVSSYPIPLRYPSMWLVMAPAFAVSGASSVLGVDWLMATLRVSAVRRRVILVAYAALVVVPTVCWAGHPEDLLALGLVCASVALVLRGRFAPGALVTSLAVMMQPWAVLVIPVVVVAAPRGSRLRSAFCAAALPAVCGATLLGLDWHDAYRALVLQPMQGNGQRLPWWSLTKPTVLVQDGVTTVGRIASGPRLLAVVASVAGAWAIRRRVRPDTVVLVVAAALAARGIFETQVWCWYLAPAGVFLAVAAAMVPSRRVWVIGGGCGLVFYAFVAASYDAWQMPPLLALAILVATSGVALAVASGGVRVAAARSGPSPVGVAGTEPARVRAEPTGVRAEPAGVRAGTDLAGLSHLAGDGRQHAVDEPAGLVGRVGAGQLHRL